MEIVNSDIKDIPKIFELYRIATEYMKSKDQVAWPEFSRELITTEINEQRQWKLLIDKEIACIWATTLKDELIWGTNDDQAIYIHRIATNPNFRGGEKKYWAGIIPYYADGHAWVCDGYQSSSINGNGYLKLHMNWGWNDAHDGWYSFNNFNPNGDTYNYKVGIVINIKP